MGSTTTPGGSGRDFQRLVAVVGIVLYVGALCLPAFHQARPGDEVQYSFMLLLVGWMGILVGYVAWFASPCIWFSWVMALRGEWLVSGVSALVATLLIVTFLATTQMHWPLYERDANPRITSWDLGYWLWLGSALWMLGMSVVGLFLYPPTSSPRRPPKQSAR